ncbi:hypothetical protein [Paludisphaera sp.]|uniref:hypothetical protein n=1 Tax=Paludisphaera sp. TaxID=2017432 RepID=UPI00301CCBF7
MTNRRLFLSSVGLAVAALAAAGCGDGTPVPPAGSGGDLSNLPEGERLAEEGLVKLQEANAKKAGSRKKD